MKYICPVVYICNGLYLSSNIYHKSSSVQSVELTFIVKNRGEGHWSSFFSQNHVGHDCPNLQLEENCRKKS
jgi:hypothetical protein